MAAWDDYLGLSSEERSNWSTLPSTLSSLLTALQSGHPEPPIEVRRRLIGHLLDSLSPSSSAPLSKTLHPSSPATLLDPTLALLKLLGRSAAGSEELGRERGLTVLLSYGGLARAASSLPPKRYRHGFRARHRNRHRGLGISEIVDGEDPESFVGRDDEGYTDEAQTPMPGMRSAEPDPLSASESEALRCLCNVLMLHPTARELFPILVQEDRAWMAGMVRLLPVQGAGFLAGRLTFLLTSKPGDHISDLAEASDLVDHLEDFANGYIAALRSPSPNVQASLDSGSAPTTTAVLHEHLKLIYNLMLQYSRSQPPRRRTSTADSMLSPSSGAGEDSDGEYQTDGSRPSSPHPSQKGRKKKHFWSTSSKADDRPASPTIGASPASSRGSSARSISKSPRMLAQRLKSAVTGSKPPPIPPLPESVTSSAPPFAGEGTTTGEMPLESANYFLPLFRPYLALSVLLPLNRKSRTNDGKDPSPIVRSALNTLLNFPVQLEELSLDPSSGFEECSWLQPVSFSAIAYPSLAPLPSRLLEILQITLDSWFPTDKVGQTADGKPSRLIPAQPDELIPRGGGEATRAEEILGPVMLLLRKVSLLNEAADGLKRILLPRDIDRSVTLDRRPDLIGHLCRLLSSILLPNTAYGVGEFLYNLCERDPVKLSQELGYGLAAGFLQNRGELIPPPGRPDDEEEGDGEEPLLRLETPISTAFPSAPSSTSAKRKINPITGAYEQPRPKDLKEMTDEEKEREAERLYVLFDRMRSTGVMDVENPVEKARKEGKMQDTPEELRKEADRVRAQEERDEEEAEEEMRRYKARKAAGGY